MREQFSDALQGRKIPILTLDNKWYRLLDEGARAELSGTEEQLNELLKRQGKLNTETKAEKEADEGNHVHGGRGGEDRRRRTG